ncbi:Arsenate reductase and related proteins, glutaredoxin family [Mycobacteroides abscessus subsp. massiliense]|uniref:carboxymuconolactone decarboxylase family protein n=1 Tax=Mycobacteroides abscessus TaxID=36809 RepID=UPI0009A75C89|nr:carboxymuconolactone decarboxylase family protein [Mycobacteroides abscessus]SKG70925.1 Arsenate reductase and related proteins, glutaredoxin family [Mycobacteroides abscessus subsp. massiliense]SKH21685.1 Arsenate reductase and related proteins, glutaredoxin family [Mycobacteroides abscessus subsp. massiliense]SKH93362.1 Arsenate reductase and related proteins, glutaredoxin family [Mycobacteroides abscessus subsp. massiliense]SKJ05229.1 Arsenate reductase and related proteins, glutaredoxin 
MSEHRVYIDKQTPSVYQGLSKTAAELRARAADAGLSRTTLELVNIRVSQLNRCLFCLDLHTRIALEEGESAQRIAVLPVWQEAKLFSDVERAALTIAEAVTEVTDYHLTDEQYTAVREHLSDDQVSALVWSAIMINTFNRISILSRHPIKRR